MLIKGPGPWTGDPGSRSVRLGCGPFRVRVVEPFGTGLLASIIIGAFHYFFEKEFYLSLGLKIIICYGLAHYIFQAYFDKIKNVFERFN